MKYIIPILAVAALFAGCQNDENKNVSTDDTSSVMPLTRDELSTNCYAYIKNRDTATLKLIISGEKVSGELEYHIFERDQNIGVLEGITKGDTIIADYTFNAEGSQSIRQVVWLKKGGKLIEGTGSQIENKGKSTFKDITHISFDDSFVFSSAECK